MSTKKFLIVITGPTGIGKTDLSLALNDTYGSSIISADSRQIYKEMHIGTAKPSTEEIAAGNIKLADIISVTEDYNAGQFEQDAMRIIEHDHLSSHVSMICGGTGFYIRAVCEGLNEFPDIPAEVISQIEEELQESGIESLQKRLQLHDPITYSKIDIQNSHRLVRALSIYDHTGQTLSHYQNIKLPARPFQIINIVLDDERETIYKRIEHRVDKMIHAGLIEEVESLLQYRDLKALNTVGYSEVFKYIDGDITKEFCISEIKKNSRRYAKRQLTWLRKYNDGKRFLGSDFNGIKEYINSMIS